MIAGLAALGGAACALEELPVTSDAEASAIVAVGPNAPTLVYATTRPPESATYPRFAPLTFKLTDPATMRFYDTNLFIHYQLTFQPLSDGSGVAAVSPVGSARGGLVLPPPLLPPGLPPPPPPPYRLLRMTVDDAALGLLPRAVYRVRLQLLDLANAPLGAQSDWFYLVTGGTSTQPSDTLKWGRIDVVLRALDQLGDDQAGLIGGGGTLEPDGWRFVSAAHPNYHAGDELGWCDWFYHYLGAVVTDGLDGVLASDVVVDGGNTFWRVTTNPNNIPNAFRDPLDDGCGSELIDLDGNGVAGDVLMAGCQEHDGSEVALDLDDNRFYSNIVTNIYYDAVKSLPQNQGIGNYQAMDHHAGMFLAFDPDGDGTSTGTGVVGTVWSIEGNVSNHVRIMHRAADSTAINGFGKLTESMFVP